MRRAVSGLAFLACMSVCTIATAQEFTPTVSVWAGHTDNPFAIYHPPEDAYYSDLNAGFGYLKQTTRSKIEADLRVVRRDYYGADIDGVTLPAGHASVEVDLLPDRISWVFEDTVGQVSARPYEALSNPDRATLNVFGTGPRVQLSLGDRGYLQGEARYGRSHFNQMNLDTTELGGSLTIGRELSALTKLGVVVAAHESDYGERQARGRRKFEDSYITFSTIGARTELDMAAGVTIVDTNTSSSKSSPSFRITATRQASSRTVVGLDYFRGYSESVQSFVREVTTGAGGAGETAFDITSAPFLSQTLRMDIVKGRGRFDVGLRGGVSRETYAGDDDIPPTGDRRSLDAEMAMEYKMSSRMQFVTDFHYTRYRTLGSATRSASTQQAWSGTAGLLTQISRSLGVGALFVYSKGDADFARSRDFIERRFIAGIVYEPRSSTPRLYDPMRNFRRFQAQVAAKLPRGSTASQ